MLFITRLKNKLQTLYSTYKLTISLASFICGMFLIFISIFIVELNPLNSKIISGTSSIFWTICFFTITNKKRNKIADILIQISIMLVMMLLLVYSLYFWYQVLTASNSIHFFWFLLFSIITFLVMFYLIHYIQIVFYQLTRLIEKLTQKLFPNSSTSSTGFRYFFERLTSLLLAIGGTLTALLTIATTCKSILSLFELLE